MQHELERLNTVCDEEEVEIDHLESVLRIVERLVQQQTFLKSYDRYSWVMIPEIPF